MADYGRMMELKQFDESKTGVNGLVDSGLTSIPRFFVHPPETLSDLKPSSVNHHVSIPVVDLSGFDSDNRRSAVVDVARRAAREFGFFQVVNHGIPQETLDLTIEAIKAFHELPPEIRSQFYRREMGTGVSYLSNVDLFKSKAASWRDTLQVRLGPTTPAPDQLPEVCASAVAEWDREVTRLGGVLMDVVGEGLGLAPGRFSEMTCLEGRTLVGHYYPYCPEPDRTVGIATHADPGVLTVLMQDHVGGLQIEYGGAWVDVVPVPGALVINIGDLLQIASNDEYKSVEHRVLANSCREPRVSIAVFFNPGDRERTFGPLPELISREKPAVYREFKPSEFMLKFFTRELDGKEEAKRLAYKLKKITVADIEETMKVTVLPFSLQNNQICHIYKLEMKLFRPDHHQEYGSISSEECGEILLENAIKNHLALLGKINGIQNFTADSQSMAPNEGDEDFSSSKAEHDEENYDRGDGENEGQEDLGLDAEKQKGQATDEMDYEDDGDEGVNKEEIRAGSESEDDKDENEVEFTKDNEVDMVDAKDGPPEV